MLYGPLSGLGRRLHQNQQQRQANADQLLELMKAGFNVKDPQAVQGATQRPNTQGMGILPGMAAMFKGPSALTPSAFAPGEHHPEMAATKRAGIAADASRDVATTGADAARYGADKRLEGVNNQIDYQREADRIANEFKWNEAYVQALFNQSQLEIQERRLDMEEAKLEFERQAEMMGWQLKVQEMIFDRDRGRYFVKIAGNYVITQDTLTGDVDMKAIRPEDQHEYDRTMTRLGHLQALSEDAKINGDDEAFKNFQAQISEHAGRLDALYQRGFGAGTDLFGNSAGADSTGVPGTRAPGAPVIIPGGSSGAPPAPVPGSAPDGRSAMPPELMQNIQRMWEQYQADQRPELPEETQEFNRWFPPQIPAGTI